MKQCCNECKYWIPDQSSWVVKANKYPGPRCALNGELAGPDQAGCLVWTPKKEQEENR